MLRSTLPLAILMLVLAASTAWCVLTPPQYCTFYYGGNMDPTTPGSAGSDVSGLLRFSANGKNVVGTIVSDPDTDDNLAWEVADTTSGVGDRCFYSLVRGGGVAIDQLGTTILGRIKTLSDPNPHVLDRAGGNLGILDPVLPSGYGNSVCLHWGGENGHVEDIWRDEATTIAGDADYHTFRVTIAGRMSPVPAGANDETWTEGFETYTVDTKLDGQDEWTGGAPGGNPPIVQGLTVVNEPTGSTGHGKVVAFFSGNLVYRESIPVFVSPDPVTHEMVFEYDMYSDGTNGPDTSWFIDVNDREGINIAQFYGTGTSASGRINGGTATATSAPLPIGWHHFKMLLNASTNKAQFYVTTGGITTELLPLGGLTYNAAAEEAIGEIAIRSPWLRGAFNLFYLDNFDVTGAHYVDPPNARRIKVYKDELGPPILDFIGGAVDSYSIIEGSQEGFMFGTDDTPATQTVRFDWVSGTNRGAFAPGEEVAVLGQSLIAPTSIAHNISEAKTMPVPTTVLINGATVSCGIYEQDNTEIGFSIQNADRTDGIRIQHTWTGDEGGEVMPGSVVNFVGVTSTDRGELHIDAPIVTWVSNPLDDVPVWPDPLSMNNKASGGGALLSQPGLWEMVQGVTTETFDYANGPLAGSGYWSGGTSEAQAGVVDGQLKMRPGTAPSQSVVLSSTGVGTNTHTAETSVMVTSVPGTEPGYFWYLHMFGPGAATIATWYGTYSFATPRFLGDLGTSQALTTSPKKLGIKADFDNLMIYWYADDVEVYTHALPVGITSVANLSLQNQLNTTANGAVLLDNLVTPFDLPQAVKGLNNVGLYVRLYGRVTAVKSDGASDDENYFYIDDGSGLRDQTTMGIRCKPPSMATAVLPTLGDYVAVEGVMGVRDGARYLWTWDWQLQ